jgi:hypothetical protein
LNMAALSGGTLCGASDMKIVLIQSVNVRLGAIFVT